MLVDSLEGGEQAAEVDGHVRDLHLAEVIAEVLVAEVGQYSDDLIRGPEGCDQGADGGTVSQVVEKLELVEDAVGARGDIDLFDGDVSGAATFAGY